MILVAIAVATSRASGAQTPGPRPQVGVQASQDRFTVGDRVTLDVTVEHAPGDSIVWPEITDPMGPFEVQEAEAVRPTVENGRQTSILRLTITAFELGDLEFPSMTVGVVPAGGGDQTDFDTDPVALQVESVGLEDGGDIRDIKPPLGMPRNWLLLVPWALALVAVLGGGYWAYRRYRRRRRGMVAEPPRPARPPRPPHEVALEAFARLRETPLLERGEIKRYFTEASEILRRYVEARCGVEAMELPSADILHGLRATGLKGDLYARFRQFFDRADLVKFAKQRPTPEVSAQIVSLGEEIVRAVEDAAGTVGAAGAGDRVDAADTWIPASSSNESVESVESVKSVESAESAESAPSAEAGRRGGAR